MASQNLLYLTFWGLEGSQYCSSKPGIFIQYHMNTICLRIEICHTSGWIQQCGVAAWITPSTHSMPTDKKWPQCKILQRQSQKQNSVKIYLSPLSTSHHVPAVDSAMSRMTVSQWSSAILPVYWGCSPRLQLLRGFAGFITRRKQQDCYSLAFDLLSKSFILFWLLFFADQKCSNYQIKL